MDGIGRERTRGRERREVICEVNGDTTRRERRLRR
jgi:hypothetical protein